MPAASTRRQPERSAEAWFLREPTLRLIQDVQRRAIPELIRVFGHSGLFLRPGPGVPAVLSGNLLAQVISLHRAGGRLGGDLDCEDGALPVASGCLALAYGLFVLESSSEPERLLGEMARVLKPDGTLMLLTFNPWVPLRLRWMGRGLQPVSSAWLAPALAAHGLELQRRRAIGPVWAGRHALDLGGPREGGLTDGLRAASLWVARRREAGLIPLRNRAAGLAFRPGVSAG